MRILGLDVGGANLKLATAAGGVKSLPFEMWKRHERLTEALQQAAVQEFGQPDLVAVTMTAELADCFENKAAGVRHVLESVAQAFPRSLIRVWLTSGEFAEFDDAVELPSLVAAANWHALASWCGRAVPQGAAIVFDIGSTTTDIIPLLDGFPVPAGLTDRDRLLSGELVYAGARRTPVCAVVNSVPLHHESGGVEMIPVAAEMFSTVLDAFLASGLIPDDPGDVGTADGRPATALSAHNRLAHQICCDGTELTRKQTEQIARYIAGQMTARLRNGLETVLRSAHSVMEATRATPRPPTMILSGSGTWLARRVLQETFPGESPEVLDLSEMYHSCVSESACAFAVARLAAERCLDDLLPLVI